MRCLFAIAVVLLLLGGADSGEFVLPGLRPVEATNPDLPLLHEWQNECETATAQRGEVALTFGPWYEIESQALKVLFPSKRFYTIQWDMRPASKERPVSCARGLRMTFAVDQRTREVSRFWVFCNHNDFGAFLAREGTTIDSNEKAQLVWDALMDICRNQWPQRENRRISPTVWRLGVSPPQKQPMGNLLIYFYEVIVDDSNVVKSATLRYEPAKQ